MDTLKFISQLAQNTGDLLVKYFQPAGTRANLKADRTVVTDADLAADDLIRTSLQRSYPNDGILSEELGTVFPTEKERVWVVDPLDGTTNFSLGLHHWGVSIALLVNGWPQIAALYFPLLNECYTAQKGSGAFLNGKALIAKPPEKDQPASFFSCCSRTFRRYQVNVQYKARILGSAAYGLISVARGSAVLDFEATPKVWDFAASWLIMHEAGGFMQALDGSELFPLIPGTEYCDKSFPTLAAATLPEIERGRRQIIPN